MTVREDLIAALNIVEMQDLLLANRLRSHFKNEIEGTVVLKNGTSIPMSYVTMVKEAWNREWARAQGTNGWNPQRVSAVKRLRECTGFSLSDAVVAVDEMIALGVFSQR